MKHLNNEFHIKFLNDLIGVLCRQKNNNDNGLTHPWPFSKSKFNLKSDRVNLVAPASHGLVLLSVCLIYPMSGRYSTNWDRKGWPGSEIQMYHGSWGVSRGKDEYIFTLRSKPPFYRNTDNFTKIVILSCTVIVTTQY